MTILHLFQRYQPALLPLPLKFQRLDETVRCELDSRRVDIWQYPLHDLWPEDRALLNQTEALRADRYYFERHRRRFTVARATLRLILAHYLPETSPEKLIFDENKYGKPFLLDYPHLTFNLSHSEEWALLAIGQNHAVGIDLEFFSGRSYIGIGEQLFSPQENQLFQQVPFHLQALSFFNIWAQKEAFIKACGLGLSYPTQTFTVGHLPVTKMLIEDKHHHTWWHMTSFMPQIGCAAAVCYQPCIETIRYMRLEPNHYHG